MPRSPISVWSPCGRTCHEQCYRSTIAASFTARLSASSCRLQIGTHGTSVQDGLRKYQKPTSLPDFFLCVGELSFFHPQGGSNEASLTKGWERDRSCGSLWEAGGGLRGRCKCCKCFQRFPSSERTVFTPPLSCLNANIPATGHHVLLRALLCDFPPRCSVAGHCIHPSGFERSRKQSLPWLSYTNARKHWQRPGHFSFKEFRCALCETAVQPDLEFTGPAMTCAQCGCWAG